MKNNVIIGNGTGKLGNMVGYVRGGQQMFRVYQPIVNNPKSDRQVMSREKLTLASELSQALARAIRIGYGAFANSRISARNFFTRSIIPVSAEIIRGVTPDALIVDYEHLPVSAGTLPEGELATGELDLTTSRKVKFDIEEESHLYETNHDANGREVSVTLHTVVLNKDKGVSMVDDEMYYDMGTGSWLANPSIDILVPSSWIGDKVEVYCFLKQHPEAINGIADSTAPYRYPGEASKPYYVGHGTMS